MRTIIVRLVEPAQTDGELRGLVEEPGGPSVPFHGTERLILLLRAALTRPRRAPTGDLRAP
jgi:hypothetical protein